MKKILFFVIVIFSLNSCKIIDRIKPKSSKTDLIAATLWKIETLKDVEDKNLKNENLQAQAQGLFGINFEFKANKIVRASDRISKQILQQGTWVLNTEETIMTIDLPEFKGDFKVAAATSKSFLIQYVGEKKIAGLGNGVQLLLVPVE